MQNKNLPIILIILATLTIGGYMLFGGNKSQDENVTINENTETEENTPEDVEETSQTKPEVNTDNEKDQTQQESERDITTAPQEEKTTIEYRKPIAINLSVYGKNGVKWNNEINESEIQLTYSFEWSETKDGPVKRENITRTIYQGTPDYLAGAHTICPQNSIEKKMHGIPVKITLTTTINGKRRSKTISVPEKTFYCKCN